MWCALTTDAWTHLSYIYSPEVIYSPILCPALKSLPYVYCFVLFVLFKTLVGCQMRYYQLQRQQESAASSSSSACGVGNAGRVTVRALESSLRLAEAHAKLMFHRIVTFEVDIISNAYVSCCCSLLILYHSVMLGWLVCLFILLVDPDAQDAVVAISCMELSASLATVGTGDVLTPACVHFISSIYSSMYNMHLEA